MRVRPCVRESVRSRVRSRVRLCLFAHVPVYVSLRKYTQVSRHTCVCACVRECFLVSVYSCVRARVGMSVRAFVCA